MVACGTFAEFLCDQLAPLGRIMRPMFGKTAVVCDGVMFGMVTENTLYLRIDDESRARPSCFRRPTTGRRGSM
jgi:DNA transformation protein